jgi:glycosyltransferase involved in cell wall biosynthesis
MKIGIVVNSSWNIYNFRSGLVKTLLLNGHQVVAIAPNDGFVNDIKDWGCEYIPIEMDCKGSNPAKDLRLILQLFNIYRAAKLDAVLHFTIKPNIYGTFACKMLNIPAINNITGIGTAFLHQNLTSWAAQLLYRLSFKFPAKVFFQNEDDKKLFLKRKLVRPEITDVLPGSGVDLDYFKPQKTPDNKKFTFLMISRLLFDKGICEYIDAIRLMRKNYINAKFQILGKIEPEKSLGIDKEQLDEWIKEGLVEYLGTTNDVRPFIANADCIVLPSYREGTPRTLIEAASMGKPIVTTDVPGCRETVMNGFNGFLCQVKNAFDLAAKMTKVLSLSPEELHEFQLNSRAFATAKFDQNIVVSKYAQALGMKEFKFLPKTREEVIKVPVFSASSIE